MPDLERLFADYAEHHRKPLNKLTHFVGIPTIAVGLFGLGSKIRIAPLPGDFEVTLGSILAAALVAVYLVWHRGLAVGIAVLFFPLYWIGQSLPTSWLWVVLMIGVALQYIGHFVFERRAPAFHKNLVHTLVGPLWVAASLFGALGLLRNKG